MSLDQLHPRSPKYLARSLLDLVRSRLWAKVLVGMALGIVVGILLGPSVGWVEAETSRAVGNWLALPGLVFLAVLQMIIIPLVFASVIRGIAASEDLDQLKRIGLRVMAFFAATTAVAAAIGIGLALLIQPGNFIDGESIRATVEIPAEPIVEGADLPELEDLPEFLVGVIPQNPLASMVQREMLQVVLIAAIAGLALISMKPETARPLLDLLGSVLEVCITVVRWTMLLAPLAVFGLMAQLTTSVGVQALAGLAVYVGTVLLGLLLVLGMYLVLVRVIAGFGPLRFLGHVREVMLLAFSTSSSAAVLPLSIKTADEKLRVRPSISQFVVPLGVTVNMTGTALYQAVATVFLAQLFGVELGLGSMVLVILIAVASSIGAPATPGVGMVILATLLQSVGIPLSGIAIVMGVDRILDMSRTSVNVTGDLAACAIMDRWIGGPSTPEEERRRQAEQERIRQETGEDVLIAAGAGAAG